MAYRGDIEALEARAAALTRELGERERERDEVSRMLDEARARARADAYVADLEAGGPARRRARRLRITMLSAGLVMVVGALAVVRAHPPRDLRFEHAMHVFQGFSDEMCQCIDAVCAQHVSDEMTTWSMAVAKDWQPPPQMSEAQTKRATDVGMRLMQCMSKAMSAGPVSD